jgi:putative acetyltransferase
LVILDGLREATDADSWSLIALIAACWAEYPGCITDVAGEYPELLAPARHYHDLGGRLWVLPEGGWIAGCVGVCPGPGPAGPGGHQQGPGRAELVKLYVARHRRRQGLGPALVDVAEQAARDLGCTVVELWSDTRFLDAHRLYQRLGYRPTGATRQLYDLSATEEYAFAKSLASAG